MQKQQMMISKEVVCWIFSGLSEGNLRLVRSLGSRKTPVTDANFVLIDLSVQPEDMEDVAPAIGDGSWRSEVAMVSMESSLLLPVPCAMWCRTVGIVLRAAL